MHDSMLTKKYKELSQKYIKALQLEKIDHQESLTFLHRNYGVNPSEIISAVTLFFVLVVLLLDGFNIVASVLCFLLPLFQCLRKIGSEENKLLNFGGLNQS